MDDQEKIYKELLNYVVENNRICPNPDQWAKLWEMLPAKKREGLGWKPPVPLILNAWQNTSGSQKSYRLKTHLHYAKEMGIIKIIDDFLRKLKEEDWLHENEL